MTTYAMMINLHEMNVVNPMMQSLTKYYDIPRACINRRPEIPL